MKTTISPKEGRGWPGHLLWGRVRTSTVVLLIAFCGTWWLYETYQPAPTPDQVPATNVVPPGFIPDPAYTWVPRTDVQRSPEATTTPTTSEASTTPTSPGADVTAPDTPTSGEQPTSTSGLPTSSTTAVPTPSSTAPTTATAPSAASARPSPTASTAVSAASPAP